jgi:YidC/Oxa1 family membrane protein insertase
MEENKLDYKQFIGFGLLALIGVFWRNSMQPTEEEIAAQEAEKAKTEQIATQNTDAKTAVIEEATLDLTDSIQAAKYNNSLGSFGNATSTVSMDGITTIENQLLSLKVSNKGGQIVEVRVKGQIVKKEFEPLVTYDSLPVYLVKDGNSSFGLDLTTSDNRVINTTKLAFEPTYTENGDNKVLSMKYKVAADKYLEYRYELKKDDYMVDFTVRSQGLNGVIDASKPVSMEWKLKSFRHAKSVTYENRYTDLHYEYEDGKDSYLGQATDEEKVSDVTWLGYKQHFFTSILLTDTAFKTATLSTENIVDSEMLEKDVKFLKQFGASIPLELKGGELNHTMDLYHGPTDYDTLTEYDRNLDEIVPLGWGIFGWINRYLLIPLFGLLSAFLPAGIAIVVMTILVRLLLSPVTYKSYVSQAKMKVIRPEIAEINEKFKDDAMKKQQATMKLYGKAGVSPMAGCVPALMQIPVFYALFMFFPSAFELRQKSFLWAEDLSSYDTIYQFPEGFSIPLYGDHISLLPILASIAIFFYMKMTTGQQMMSQQPAQEGMPDMSKMMKYMMYFSPLMMLFFFNNYASGLSLYYFVSNLITIGIMLVIKNYIIDNDKIHAKIEENKKKPKKQNRFQKKMQDMMEQAEAQKKANKK